MADKKLNEVSQLTDFDYALVVKGNDVAKVTKQQLATILGGLLPFFPTKGSIKPGSDLNTIGGTGIYNLKGAYTNAPFSQSWGNLIVLSDGSKTQIVTEYTGSTFSIFIRGDNTRKWYKVNFTKDI